MAKGKKKSITETAQEQPTQEGKSIEQLMQENDLMRKQIEEMGKVSSSDPISLKYLNEVNQIKKLARVDTTKIQVKEIVDHKNISLWTRDGDRIGPMHQANCLAALQRFFNLGIILSTKQPTPEEIEAYKQTDEYKAKHAKFLKDRERKNLTKKRGELERILKDMAKTYGLTMDKLIGIVKPEDVKSLAEGRKSALSS